MNSLYIDLGIIAVSAGVFYFLGFKTGPSVTQAIGVIQQAEKNAADTLRQIGAHKNSPTPPTVQP